MKKDNKKESERLEVNTDNNDFSSKVPPETKEKKSMFEELGIAEELRDLTVL